MKLPELNTKKTARYKRGETGPDAALQRAQRQARAETGARLQTAGKRPSRRDGLRHTVAAGSSAGGDARPRATGHAQTPGQGPELTKPTTRLPAARPFPS